MILKSIELENFMCYYGYNKFDFKEGINVIIGDNGYGKSKLYDAFYWVMYDECFDTNKKEFVKTSILKNSIVSDKALFEVDDDRVKTSVTLTFDDVEKGSEYSIQRRYFVNKLEDTITPDYVSEEIISWKELSYLNSKIINDPLKIENLKNRILPDNIKPYMWFQGEQIESIIDFNKSQTLTQAINILSDISRFDNISSLADSLQESSAKEYNKKIRSLSKDTSRSEQLEIERKKLIITLKNLEKDELSQQDQQSTAEQKAEALLNKISDAQKIKDVDYRRKSIENDLINIQQEFNKEQIDLHKKLFTNRWVLKGTENIFEEYGKKYNSYEKVKLNKMAEVKAQLEAENAMIKELQTRLPIDVPEPIHVERMLDEEHCLVCDREAPKGSEPWLKMKELIDRSKLRIKNIEDEEITIHDFSNDLKKLYQNGLGLSHNIKRIDDDISKTFTNIQKLSTKRKTLSQDLEKLEKEVESMISESAIDVSEAQNLLSSYQSQNDYAKRFQKELTLTEVSKERTKKQIEIINKELGDLVTGEIPAFLQEKVEILEDFKAIAHSTRERIFKQLVNMLEEEANKHYKEMIQGNLSARGIIKLKELSNKNYMPELVDENGNVLLQLNTGNIILIKLATIMAIISARKGSRDTDLYTLITDAPMSAFGDDYTIGFCKTVSKVYKQSIIMSKEFYKNIELRNELLNNKDIKLGKVYMITPNIPEEERTNRNSLATNIKPLN
nr:AAA family ATPase [uncultured Psychroserpens sp.]